MKELKFSMEFKKLWGQQEARLIHMKIVKIENLHQDFIDYDVKDYDDNMYDLKGDLFLFLVFLGDKNIPFTTLRDTSKLEKYNIGEKYNISIINLED